MRRCARRLRFTVAAPERLLRLQFDVARADAGDQRLWVVSGPSVEALGQSIRVRRYAPGVRGWAR
jgi:hypothetical protein